MENPATQKDSSKMNTVRRAGLIILLFGLGLLFWSVPAHSESAVVVRVIDGVAIVSIRIVKAAVAVPEIILAQVVGWIDINNVHLTGVPGSERGEYLQVIAFDQHVGAI